MDSLVADGSEDDQRHVELTTLVAIYPELQVDDDDPYSFSYEVPVNPTKEVTVLFPATVDGAAPDSSLPSGSVAPNQTDSHSLSYLPSVRLQITLPMGYPEEKPPVIAVSTSPSWLPEAVAIRLQAEGTKLWESLGRDLVVYSYIDHILQAAEGDVFGLVNDKGVLEVDPQHKIAILDHDIKSKRVAFDKGTFECGICLDPKKGTVCHRMLDCGHVFCVQCLQDFYNTAITEGDLVSVRCLAPNCAKERERAGSPGRRGRKPKTFISPSELLQIPLEQDIVKRYVTLKYKTELESDKNTIYCPRSWCNGAARSKKHKKPEGFELKDDDSDGAESESEDVTNNKSTEGIQAIQDLLSVCEDCDFAFCSRCQLSWHGEFVRCKAPRSKEELTAEEQASLEYMSLHTTPCPTCAAPAQKTHGCNHMICFRCQTHFCYLCSAWLDPSNPYAHYNKVGNRMTGCYQRLWELEAGDGGDVDYGFYGGVPGEDPPQDGDDGWGGGLDDDDDDDDDGWGQPMPVFPPIPPPEIEEPDDNVEVDLEGPQEAPQDVAPIPPQEQANEQPVDVAREGPLVLRIAAAAPAAAAAPPLQRAPRGRGGNAGLQRGRGRGRGGLRGGAHLGGGEGGRGGGRGGRGGAHGQQQNQQRDNQGRNNNARGGAAAAAVGGGGGGQRRGAAAAAAVLHRANNPAGEPVRALNEANQAWIRHFVQLALNDDEDQMVESDSDEDDEEVIFWRDDER